VTNGDFPQHVFTAPPELRRLLISILERLADKEQPFRILDLGCGTGAQLIDVAAAFPHSQCVGVDVSSENIARARMSGSTSSNGSRLSFYHHDYLLFASGPFDIIVADSVLQNIPGHTDTLVRKISNDLRPAGLLIVSLPYDCIYNRLLWAARRILRLLRGRGLERVAETVARTLHPSWSADLIRERLPYLYMLPERSDGPDLRRTFHITGRLSVLEDQPLPHASLAQPKHRLVVFRKQFA